MNNRKYKHDIMTKERIIKHKIRKFNLFFDKALHDELRDTEFYGGEARLLMLLSSKDNISQSELAKKMETSAASVGVSLKKIEMKGFITRKHNESDSRANKISLTSKGESAVENLHKLFQGLDKKLFDGFSESELDTLDELMNKLHDNLDKQLGEKNEKIS